MKIRDSGMPPEEMWSAFFDVETILDKMQINSSIHDLLELGCGYGTFTLPTANRISGRLYAYDIEKEMIDYTANKSKQEGLTNIDYFNRDFIDKGTGIPAGTIDYVMLFNILHHDKPHELLRETYTLLSSGGKAGIVHWRTDSKTPRGPEMSIRPKPEQCAEWAVQTGFKIYQHPVILEPFHYGLIIEKP